MLFPNGMVLVDGGRRLVTAETFGNQLTQCAVGRELGQPWGSGRTADWIRARPDSGWPSGPGVGGLRFPQLGVAVTSAGTIEGKVELPGEGIYCCGIGGADGQALFLAVGAHR